MLPVSGSFVLGTLLSVSLILIHSGIGEAAARRVSLTAPSPAAGTVQVTATTTLTTLSRLDLTLDGKIAKSCATKSCSYSWDTRTVSDGPHRLQASVYNRGGGADSTQLHVHVANAPVVTVTVPATATGTVVVVGSAQDSNPITSMTLFLDNAALHTYAAGAFSTSWDSATVPNGTHTFHVTAIDAAGNVGTSAPMSTMVSNQAPVSVVPIPERTRWESQMITYGRLACDFYKTAHTLDERLLHTYYDQVRVMYQIADYTGDASWNACAMLARNVYRDEYVVPNGGKVPGYWNFTIGLGMDVERTDSDPSATAVVLLSNHGAYAPDSTPLAWTESAARSREVAYTILSYMQAERLGQPRRARRAQLVDQAYGHFDQWFGSFTWRQTGEQFAPFMVALSAHTLIRDWEETGDPRLVPALRAAADWLWANAWISSAESMYYAVASPNPAPDLNLLIAPMYAFLYAQTGLPQYQEWGDALFAGGVRRAWLVGGKQFNQNYFWSFDYVRWREGAR
jgi:hypothetical protein